MAGTVGIVVRRAEDVRLVRELAPKGARWMAIPRFAPVRGVTLERVIVCGDWRVGLGVEGQRRAQAWFLEEVVPRLGPGADVIQHVRDVDALALVGADGEVVS